MTASLILFSALCFGGTDAVTADIVDGGAVPMRRTNAHRTTNEVVIDGRADEADWAKAPRSGDFVERQPNLGEAPPVETYVRVLYDENALYFFIEARGQAVDDIVVRNLRRDSFAIFGDDTVTLKIDAHHDRRTSVTFAANADGAQLDSLNLEDGRVGVREWDAVWQVETQRTDDGFTLEYRIPFAVLGIKGGEHLTMGLDVSRDHSNRNATYDWRVIVPPRSPVSASSFGELHGIDGVHAQRAAEFIPYVAARTDFTPTFTIDPRNSPNIATGGDFRVQVGKGSYIEGSALTDFAQVEADEVQVAGDRFPLFFPERRPFFINGLDVFNFGAAKRAQLFFSRKIGLESGRPIAIGGGAKSYGRVGGVSYGFLNVQTLSALPDEDDPDSEFIPPENFTVGRVRWQAGNHATVGLIGLGRHRFQDVGHEAFSGGLDLELRSRDGKLRHYSFVASSWYEEAEEYERPDRDTEILVDDTIGASAYTAIEYQGLYFRPKTSWLWSDDDFQAPLGFYRRPGTTEQTASIDFVPRPRVLGLRDIEFGPRAAVITEPDYSAVLTTSYGGDIEFNWRTGWELEYRSRYRVDDVQDEFELYLYTVGADRYFGPTHEIKVGSPGRAWISGDVNYRYMTSFGGITHEPRANLRIKLGKHVGVGGTYTHRVGHLQDDREDFNFGFANGNVDIAITRNLLWDSLLRYSMAPGAETVGVQSRIRWRYRPGSDLFLVYRTQQPLGLDPVGEIPRQPFHSLTLKATIYFLALAKRRAEPRRN